MVKMFATFFFAKTRLGGWPVNKGWERESQCQGFILSKAEGCWEGVAGNGSKHVNCTINHQLQKFSQLELLTDRSIFPTLTGRKTAGFNAPRAFLFLLFSIFLVVTCPRPLVFARPNKYSSRLSLHRQELLSWVTVTHFTPRGGGENNGGV